MKKALVVLLALTCLSAMAFADDVAWTFGVTVKTGAQITLNADTAATITPYDADDSVASRVRFDAEAALGDFSAHVRVGGDLAGKVSSSYILTGAEVPGDALTSLGTFLPAWWVNMFFAEKMVQLQFGVLDHSVTDTVNKGWGGLNVSGGQVVVSPISGLSVGLAIPAVSAESNDQLNGALAAMRIGFAYTMTDLVTLRATYVNGPGDKTSDLFAGVAILMVPSLTAQFEVQALDFGGDVTTTKTGFIELFQNLVYAIGPLSPGLEADESLPNDSAAEMAIMIKPKVDYMVMEGLNIGGSFAYTMNAGFVKDATVMVIDPYVKFTFNAKAALKIDAAYTINTDVPGAQDWTCPININFMFAY